MDEKYSVIELAELVGVPRTTINDWLNKYSQYIEFVIQGKRRIYTENTLMVLKKIQELRNQGISCTDIETQLSTQFAVHPVPQDDLLKDFQNKAEVSAGQENAVPASETVQNPEQSSFQTDNQNQTDAGEYALIAQKHSEEIARAVADRFQEMLQKVDLMEEDAKRSSSRIRVILLITVLL